MVKKTNRNIELKAIQLYKNGNQIKDILKMCKIGNTTFFRILRRNHIKKRGQPKQRVKKTIRCCPICNKEMTLTPFLAKTRGKYCSLKCYWKSLKGKKVFDRTGLKSWNKRGLIEVKCENCGKKLKRHPYRLKQAKHQFCTTRCEILYQYKSGKFPRQTHTDIEIILKKELLKLEFKENKDFFHQYKFYNKFLCDFAFPKQKVIIECQGDFWHANPSKYPYNPDKPEETLHPKQVKGIKRDKAKEAYIRKRGWLFFPIWGYDLKHKHNRKLVANAIKEIIERRGK